MVCEKLLQRVSEWVDGSAYTLTLFFDINSSKGPIICIFRIMLSRQIEQRKRQQEKMMRRQGYSALQQYDLKKEDGIRGRAEGEVKGKGKLSWMNVINSNQADSQSQLYNIMQIDHIPNVQIALLSELEPDEEVSTQDKKPLPKTYLYYLEKAFSLLGVQLQRTGYCKHRGSCVCSTIASSTKAAVYSYLIKAGVTSAFGVRKILSRPMLLLQNFTSKDSIRFGLFVCSFLFILRASVCSLRRKLSPQMHKLAFLLGGLVGGAVSALILQKNTRQAFGLFLMARAIDITYRSLVKKKILPEFKYFYPVLYATMMVVTGGMALGSEPAAMSPQLHPFYLLFTSETLQDQQMRQIWIARKNNQLLKQGVPSYDPVDYLPKVKAHLGKQ